MDATGATTTVTDPNAPACDADAGSLTADADNLDLDLDGNATISATANGDAVVPGDFDVTFFLVDDSGAIVQISDTPSFDVDAAGDFTIFTFVGETSDDMSEDFFDLTTITLGTTTNADVQTAVASAAICASLDATGATTTVTDPNAPACDALAGTLTADETDVELDADGNATISATANGDANIPSDFDVTFFLINDADGTIISSSSDASFDVDSEGSFTIVTFVAETTDMASGDFFDLEDIEFGTTTSADIQASLTTSGICASLDELGANIIVTDPNAAACDADAGTLTADDTLVSLILGGTADISATPNNDAVIPEDYEVMYMLSTGADATIIGMNNAPTFIVSALGDYKIHTLVAEMSDSDDPDFWDAAANVELNATTGADIVESFATASVCAALDVDGVDIFVVPGFSGDAETLSVYPNPSTGAANLVIGQTAGENVTISVFNQAGQLVSVQTVNTNDITVDLQAEDLPSGIYYLQVTGENTVRQTVFVKE